MNLPRIFLTIVGLVCVLLVAPASAAAAEPRSVADTPPNSPEGVVRPKRGMSMDRVRQQFGEPQQRLGPVGEPPITRWVFDRFTVYFEHRYVIHSVVHRQ